MISYRMLATCRCSIFSNAHIAFHHRPQRDTDFDPRNVAPQGSPSRDAAAEKTAPLSAGV